LASLGDLEVSASGERMDALELTQTGTLLGTPAYMAPEQAAGEATFASDQFGFCVTAWEALYGKRPYAGRTLDEIHAAVRAGMITTASRAGVPAHVTRALERGLAADPAARFRSMDALLAALTPARRRWPVVAAGGVAVTGIAIAMIAMPNPSAAIALDDPATRCSTRDQRIPGWDPSARTALAALLEKRGGDQAYVPRALAILDRYAGSWEVMRHAVCITSDPLRPEVLATRVACLDQRARALTTTLALVTTEVELPPREAWQALDELPAIDRCAGAEAAAPVRHSPALDNARLELARLAVTIDKLAWADLVALRTRIEALDDPRLLLDALLLEADTALALAEPVAGEAAARRALAIAEQLRDDLDKARAGALLTQALVKLNRQTEATGQLAAAVGSLDRGGTDRETGLVVLEARASVVRATGDLQAEIAIRQRVLAEQRRYHDDDSLAVVGAAIALGDACQRARDTCAKTAFAIVQAVGATGDEAKVQAAAMATVAAKEALEAGDFKNAIEQCLIAVRNIHDLFGDSELYMHTVTLLAQSYELAGDWAAASDQYREAARVLRTLPERTLLGDALTGIARVELERDRAQSALAPIREAHALARTSADRERTRDTAVVLARVLLATGKPSEIPPLLEPVLRAIDADPKPQSLQRAEASFTLAQALWQVGGERERSRARALIGDAIASFETSRERLAKPRATTLRRLVEAQLAAALAWQAQHR
ncbi:MAG: protein kinase, partial [Kofleriaceae bacterium]